MTAALQHTHPAGNVGLRGIASCPACRAEGRTLTPEQTHLVATLLAEFGVPELEPDHAAEVREQARVLLIEAVLRGAEQQRDADRRLVGTLAEQYEAEARSYAEVAADRFTRQEPDSAAEALTVAARSADRARTLRRVNL